MKTRCYNKNSKYYYNYGGRGIQICDRWKNSFSFFLEDVGERPSKNHSIDRINNDGNYEPKNCRWSTRKQQANNRRTNIMIGEKTLTQVCKERNLNYWTVYRRINRGWSIEEAICTSRYQRRTNG